MRNKYICSFKLVTPYKNYRIPNVSSYKSLISKIQHKILNLSCYSILFMLDNCYIPLSQNNFQTFSIQKNKIIKLEFIKERAIINYEKLIYDIKKKWLLSLVKVMITEYRNQIYKRAMTLKNEGFHSSSSLIKNNLNDQRMDFHKTKGDNPCMISSLERNFCENSLDFAKSNTELSRNPSIFITKKDILSPSSNQQSFCENSLDFAKSNTELSRNPLIYITKKEILSLSSNQQSFCENSLDFAQSNTELSRNPLIYITKKEILSLSSNQQSNNFMPVLSEQQQIVYYKTFNESNLNCSCFHFSIDLNKTQEDTAEMRIPMKTNVNRLDSLEYERTKNHNIRHLRIKSIENSVKIIFSTIQSYTKGEYSCEIQISQANIILNTITIILTIL